MARLSDLLGGVSRGRGPTLGELDPSRPRHRRYLGHLQATSRSIFRLLRHPRVRLNFALRSRSSPSSPGVAIALVCGTSLRVYLSLLLLLAMRYALQPRGTAQLSATGALAGASAVSVGGPETTSLLRVSRPCVVLGFLSGRLIVEVRTGASSRP